MELKHTARSSGRLSTILKEEIRISTGLMNRLKVCGKLLVNGRPEFTNFPVQAGDLVTLVLDDPEIAYPAEEMALDILYEDEHLLAVEKPAGMLIHPSRHRDVGTLANGVAWYYQKTRQRCAFHPVTRLDRDTFGVVLLAKSSHVHALLQSDGLQKVYHALVHGIPEPPQGVIDAPIARKALPSLLREIRPDGKPSRTEYRLLEAHGTHALVELTPITGRTHQLRLHCLHMGHPILGDPQYATEASRTFSQALGYPYQRLCAKSVTFRHPITGAWLQIISHQSP